MYINQKSKNFYLEYSKNFEWHKSPLKTLILKNKNRYEWFSDGIISSYQNLITKNLKKKSKIALIIITKKNKISKYTYEQLDRKVNQVCNSFFKKTTNLKKLRVMIHSSATIESSILILACCKLGIHFSVIFEDLETIGINNRIKLFKPNIFFSRYQKKNFFNKFKLKKNKKIKFFFVKDFEESMKVKSLKKYKNSTVNSHKSFCTLFTSGSTGLPKGVTHSTAGYLLYSRLTSENQFGLKEDSIILAASDVGWLNGHTYSLFGPFLLGATTVIIESPMMLLDEKFLNKILKLGVTILYLPVTVIRLIKSLSRNKKYKHKIKSIGSMGEPLAPTVGKWFSENFSKNKNQCVVNAYFQTETGGIISSPKFNEKSTKVPHGSVGKPIGNFLKINKLYKNKKVEIKITTPWPGMMKNILNGKKEWDKYWDKKNNFRLFDLATISNRNIFIHGRNDDVINVRGHRIGSEEIESTVLKIKGVTECSAISINDELEGSRIYLFLVGERNLDKKIEKIIVSTFGSFALPKKILNVKELPKTKSGKILRRLMRELIKNPHLKNFGDTSTILNYKSIGFIKDALIKL